MHRTRDVEPFDNLVLIELWISWSMSARVTPSPEQRHAKKHIPLLFAHISLRDAIIERNQPLLQSESLSDECGTILIDEAAQLPKSRSNALARFLKRIVTVAIAQPGD